VRPAAQLVRVVRDSDGTLRAGRPGRDGRGAWLCADDPGCADPAARKGVRRAFREPVGAVDPAMLRAIVAERARIEVRPLGALGASMGPPTSGESPDRRNDGPRVVTGKGRM